jgi:choline dehydrogenase-like flavoprotein
LAGKFDMEFDVVVAGGGSAGCVLATRLTENPAITLCLIEAGGRDRNPWIHIPLGFGKLVPNPKVNWGYETEPEPHLNGRRLSWPRGKVLGHALVAPSLGAQRLPSVEIEHNVRGADAYGGQGGPMTISDITKSSVTSEAFVEACKRLQYPFNPDFNGERIAPGVGKNLQDHVQARFTFLTRQPGTLNEILTSTRQQARMALEWLTSASGQLAVGATEGTLFAKSDPAEPVPDLQFQATNVSTEHLTLGLDRWPGFGFNFCVCRPKSRGEIKLADGTGRSKPRIVANYFSDPEDDDMRRSVKAFHIGRQIIATEPYRSLIFSEVRPGAQVVAEDDIRSFIRQVAGTVYHPCGTCRIGQDEKAVVDLELRVRGFEGLRVADASVMPAIPSPNIHPATIMIAEKGSDAISRSLAG